MISGAENLEAELIQATNVGLIGLSLTLIAADAAVAISMHSLVTPGGSPSYGRDLGYLT
jgi:hypothetical protein